MSVNAVNSDGSLLRVAGGTLYADAPIGAIIPFGGSVVPSGYLLCNGQAVSRTTYAELFAVIGTAFGTGDGSTTFNVPDLREATTKGVGLNAKGAYHYDNDGIALGEFVDDRIKSHAHNVYVRDTGHNHGINYTHGQFTPGVYGFQSPFISDPGDATTKGGTANIQVSSTSNFSSINNSTTANGSATNEVKAVGVNYIIKAKQVAVPFDVAEYVKAYNSPDWDNAINISSNLSTTDYTITDDGWIAGNHYATGGNVGVAIEVNGIPVTSAGNNTSYGWVGQCMAKVSKGDKVKFNKSGFTNVDIYFVPHK